MRHPRPIPSVGLFAAVLAAAATLAMDLRAQAAPSGVDGYVPSPAWLRRAPAAAGFDPVKLEAAIEFARSHETERPRDFSDQARIFGRPLGPLPRARGGTNGLVLRGGAIVAEFGNTTAVEPMYSAAKSMLSTVLGLAIDRGLIGDIDGRVGAQVRDGGYDTPQNQSITWRQHVTQTSEWEGDLFGKSHRFLGADEFGEGARQPRELKSPGQHYEYNDVRINRFAISLLRVWKKPVPDVFRDEVMAPIGAATRGAGSRTTAWWSTWAGRPCLR